MQVIRYSKATCFISILLHNEVIFSVTVANLEWLCWGMKTPVIKYLVLLLFCGYVGIFLPVGQFASYCNVLNNRKAIIPNATASNKTNKCKSLSPDQHHQAALAENVHHYPDLDDITPGYEFTAMKSNLLTTEAVRLGEFSADSTPISTSSAVLLPSVVPPSMANHVQRINSASPNKSKCKIILQL